MQTPFRTYGIGQGSGVTAPARACAPSARPRSWIFPAAAGRAICYCYLTKRDVRVEHRPVGALSAERVSFQVEPSRYRHWRLTVDGAVGTLAMDVDEHAGLRDGYELKLNSYDLGVDIELYDAVQRLRFEHPEVRTVVLTSVKDKVFCAGAVSYTHLRAHETRHDLVCRL